MTASYHYDFMSFVLDDFNQIWSSMVCIVGDNFNPSKAFLNLSSVPFIGFEIHRFNLAVQLLVVDEELLLEKLNLIMSQLNNVTLVAKLLKNVCKRAKKRNATI